MAVGYNPKIVTDGLVLCLDAGNTKSYPGSGSSITDISGNGVTATASNFTNITTPYTGIRLNVGSGRINLSSIEDITTVELWFYQNVNTSTRYLLDMRTGGSQGWFYSGGPGSNWSGGKMYVNGVDLGTPNWSNMESITFENYSQVVLIANTPASDDMNLFSRYSNNESMGVTFYSAKVYNRALTSAEVEQNYNALKGRYQ